MIFIYVYMVEYFNQANLYIPSHTYYPMVRKLKIYSLRNFSKQVISNSSHLNV